MAEKKDTALTSTIGARDPFAILRQMTAELDKAFDEPFWPSLRWVPSRAAAFPQALTWAPKVDVVEREGRLLTRVDLPGVKKEDVTVEVTDGHIAMSGERKHETEETQDNIYRAEREYGSFYRAVALPEGAKLEDVKATFADGVLEVSVPLPAKAEARVRKVAVQEAKPGKAVAA
jgi:HSP20 family protein